MKTKKTSILLSIWWLAISLQAQIIGPVTGLEVIQGMSANGRYVVGSTRSSGGAGFIWDSADGNLNYSAFDTPSYAYAVSNDRRIAGNFMDILGDISALSGGYSEVGNTWVSLGAGLLDNVSLDTDGTSAHGITPDGNTIVGYSRKILPDDKIYVPYAWTRNASGEWTGEEWAHPASIIQGYILAIASNGKAVGFIHTGGERRAILWQSPQEYELPQTGNGYSEYRCISFNGKYAGFNNGGLSSGQAGVHNLETGEKTLMPSNTLINAVSDNGFAVGIYRPGSVDKSFIWEKTMGFMDFGDFIRLYASNLSLTTELISAFDASSSSTCAVKAITSDGLTFAVQIASNGVYQVYLLKINAQISVFPYPKNLQADVPVATRNRVTLTWESPDLQGQNLTGYAISRNKIPIVGVSANTLTYTETLTAGYYSYTVRAIYNGKDTSNVSNTAQAVVVNSYQLPFYEDFSSLNLTKNYWSTSVEKGGERIGWNVYDNVGIDGYGLTFNANNSYYEYEHEYQSALISKYFDGRGKSNIFLSLLTRTDYYPETTLTPDTLWVDVLTGETWQNAGKFVYGLYIGWETHLVDLSNIAKGNYFRIRLRITGANYTVSTKYIHFDEIRLDMTLPSDGEAPKNLLAQQAGDTVRLAWQSSSTDCYPLTYAKSTKQTAIGDEGVPFIAVNAYDAEETAIYSNLYLNSISAYINRKVSSPTIATQLRLAVFDGETRIDSSTIQTFTPNAWNTFPLANPLAIDGKNLKFGIEVLAHDALEQPIGVDGTRRPVSGKGDLYSEDGGATWHTLTDARLVNNWCIIGNVGAAGNTATRDWNILGYDVYKDGVKQNDDLLFGQNFLAKGTGRYTVRACSFTSGISGESSEIVIENNDTSVVINPPDTTALPTPAETVLQVYINPSNNMLTIATDSEIENVLIYGIDGKLILRSKENAAINVQNLPAGMYFVEVGTKQSSADKSATQRQVRKIYKIR